MVAMTTKKVFFLGENILSLCLSISIHFEPLALVSKRKLIKIEFFASDCLKRMGKHDKQKIKYLQ